MVPHNRRPSGSGFAWTDADPGPGGENPRSQCFGCIFNESGSGNANRNKLKVKVKKLKMQLII